MPAAMLPSYYTLTPERKLRYNFHRGQWRAWNSPARFILLLAGTQSGKTVFGPTWLYREIQSCGPGDYLTVTPTFQLLGKKALPAFIELFEKRLQVGRYVGSPIRRFEFTHEGSRRTWGDRWDGAGTTVFFGHAQDPDSLESATVKAAWLDEAGQRKFRRASWDAIRRRLSIYSGRVLVTTTPYDLGWLKQVLYDPWRAGDPSIEVVNFKSIENPAFPRAEYDAARRDLPAWKFQMFYEGRFERPAGLIYDCVSMEGPHTHRIPRFVIPYQWPRYLGLDFGGVHTAGVFYAAEPGTGRLYAYREYLAGSRTAQEHVQQLLQGEPGVPTTVGGAWASEEQWRREFRAAGLPVRPPAVAGVEVGIERVYGAHKRDEIYVFEDLGGYLEEKITYSYELDDNDQPTARIADKQDFHFMDAERYVIGWLKRPTPERPALPVEAPRTGAAQYLTGAPGSSRGQV